MSILTPPLSKRGILKALGQDPSKSDVLTVSTNSDGGLGLSAPAGPASDRVGVTFGAPKNIGAFA